MQFGVRNHRVSFGSFVSFGAFGNVCVTRPPHVAACDIQNPPRSMTFTAISDTLSDNFLTIILLTTISDTLIDF
jgi:hypothetical protein